MTCAACARSYPTIYFKPAGKKPQKYEEGREVDDMVKYIKKHATKSTKKN
jgi:hypothetical protein